MWIIDQIETGCLKFLQWRVKDMIRYATTDNVKWYDGIMLWGDIGLVGVFGFLYGDTYDK